MRIEHLPVMAAEVVKLLMTRTDGRYVDCTVNGAGHAYHMLTNAPAGRLLGIDVDASAIERAEFALAEFGERVLLVRGNFGDLAGIATAHGFEEVDGVLFDLGFSSVQLDDPSRGFSYRETGPLDMRLDTSAGITAKKFLERVTERDLAGVLREFGEEKRAHPIARSIIRAREHGELETTSDLASAVAETKPVKRNKTLSRVFQAIRIAVNGELDNLRAGLEQAVGILRPGGRIGVISYHSLEDRIVKQFFVRSERPCVCPRDIPQCVCGRVPTLRIVTRHVVVPPEVEVAANPRARSAKLRVAERLAEGEAP